MVQAVAKKISWISTVKIVAAVLCAALALIASPWFVAKYIALDHALSEPLPFVVISSLFAALAVIALISALRSRRTAARIQPRSIAYIAITVLLSTALCVVGAETYLRIAVDPQRVLDGDAWWEYRWRESHPASDNAHLTDQRYGFDRYDPLFGWRPRADFSGDGITTNSMGIRADREFAFEHPGDDTTRIVIVGDSYTWGECVRNGETYADRLAELLPGSEVINLGVHGYGTDQQLLYLREFGLRFDPDLVILGFFDLDIERNVRAFRDYAKPLFKLDETGALVLTNTPIPPPEEILSRTQRLPRSFLLAMVRKAIDIQLGRTVFSKRRERYLQRLTCAILDQAYVETKNSGAEFLLVFIPWSMHEQLYRSEELLEDWARSSGVPFLNLQEHFEALPHVTNDSLYADPASGGHWKPAGHRIAAEAIASVIVQRKLLAGSAERR